MADIDEDGGSETMRLVVKGGGEAQFVQVDVTKAGEVESMVEEVVSAFGGLVVFESGAQADAVPGRRFYRASSHGTGRQG